VFFSRLGGTHAIFRVLLLGSIVGQLLGAGDRALTVREAEQLARAALRPETKRSTGLSLEADRNPRRCVTFDVLWSNPGPGSVHSQFLTVDLQTAEVWSPTVWRRITTPALHTAQRSLRTRLHISRSNEQSRANTSSATNSRIALDTTHFQLLAFNVHGILASLFAIPKHPCGTTETEA
jgi:hypothetical protein